MTIIVGLLVAAALALVTNLVSDFLAPKAKKRKRLIWGIFAILLILSIVFESISNHNPRSGIPVPANASMNSEKITQALRVIQTTCFAGSDISIQAKGEGGYLILKQGAAVEGEYKESEIPALLNKLKNEAALMNEADKVRECMDKYTPQILGYVLGQQDKVDNSPFSDADIKTFTKRMNSLKGRIGLLLIQKTHPTGRYIDIQKTSTEASPEKNLIGFNLVVQWKGVINPYMTTYMLWFTRDGFDRLEIRADTAILKIDHEHHEYATASLKQMPELQQVLPKATSKTEEYGE